MQKTKVLALEASMQSRSILLEALIEYEVLMASDAQDAIIALNEHPDIRVVVMDMSLGGHSGMEFLYELRTYSDWSDVNVIVYSSVELPEAIVSSRAWQQLNVFSYMYKPRSYLNDLCSTVQRAL